jgi:hypothetical protein
VDQIGKECIVFQRHWVVGSVLLRQYTRKLVSECIKCVVIPFFFFELCVSPRTDVGAVQSMNCWLAYRVATKNSPITSLFVLLCFNLHQLLLILQCFVFIGVLYL